ncbi:CYTH domain-containing protein, partial [Patescibacteria group bacterium]|nr:CYTH domain-containing protein [Patescibacteria group bacterium]
MEIEYEATFTNVQKDEVRQRLKKTGAELVKPEFLMKRTVFNLPGNENINTTWLRVRDEGDKITLSLKKVDGDKIENQSEICLIVSDYNQAVSLLKGIGCNEKAYQETKREVWQLGKAEISLDEWPYLEPFMEIEGDSEEATRRVAEQLGFDWDKAKFCAVATLYSEKYGLSINEINNN